MGDNELYTSMSQNRFLEIVADIKEGDGDFVVNALKECPRGMVIDDLPKALRVKARQLKVVLMVLEEDKPFFSKLMYLPWRRLRAYKDGRVEAE